MKILLQAFLIMVSSTLILGCNPMKVTDPSNPKFDPDQFSFKDNFFNRQSKIDAFRKLFPPGTSKEFVDRVLIESGGARTSQTEDLPGLWHYSEPSLIGYPAGPVHTFIFNDSNEIENINFANTEYLYSDRLTIQKIRESINKKEN